MGTHSYMKPQPASMNLKMLNLQIEISAKIEAHRECAYSSVLYLNSSHSNRLGRGLVVVA